MKKILMGSAVLTALSLSIIAFQVSCSKTANAQTGGGNPQAGIVLFTKLNINNACGDYTSDSMGSMPEYWTVNYDGTNAKKLPIPFQSGWLYSNSPRLSPDGKTIFFAAWQPINNNSGSYIAYLFSCSIDGTNLKTLQTLTGPYNPRVLYQINGAY